MKQVIFLCSANYYRSRFAEHVFNWLAEREDLPWRADSRGLAVDQWADIGRISHFTVQALAERGIATEGEHRFPKPLTLADLTTADLVVAVKEAEHRPMMVQKFPQWENRIQYWHIDDLDCAQPEESLPKLEDKLRELVRGLSDAVSENECRAA
jgi:protein-tyrosine phosphatase